MAEASLDDFFAKKDKSKKKSKSKLKPDEILAQQGEKPIKKKKSKNVESDIKSELSISDQPKEADAEWAEVEEEKETDYSGLRIQTLQLAGKDEAENEATEEMGENGENDNYDEASGPWNKKQDDKPTPARKVVPKEPKPQAPVLTDSSSSKVQGGKYIPPGRRNNPDGASSIIGTSSTRRKPKVAPNLKSESDFPTLGIVGDGGIEFEEVRSGGKYYEDPSKRKLNLQLDNKFDALGDD